MAQTLSQGPARHVSHSFDWLRRGRRGPSYISYASLSERSACGFEFGADGVAGCCNYGGELLQMAAPSAAKGLIFARGDFSQSPYTWIARSQRVSGGSSTFGLKMTTCVPGPPTDEEDPGSSGQDINGSSTSSIRSKIGVVLVENAHPKKSQVRLDSIIDRGCFNYRWPFAEYSLLRNDEEEAYNLVGTCFTLSFVKDEVLYQILRLEQGTSALAKDGISPVLPPQAMVALSIGGAIRFDSFDTIKNTYRVRPQQVSFSLKDGGRRAVIQAPESGLRLEALVYRVDMSPGASGDSWHRLPITKLVEEVSWGEALEKQHTTDYPPFQVVYDMPKRSKKQNRDAVFVAAFKLMDSSTEDTWDVTLSERQIHDYVTGPQEICENCSPGSPLDTQYPLLDALFVNHMEQSAPFLDYTDIGLICRCLERTLQVGTVPAYPEPSAPDGQAVTDVKAPPDAKAVAYKKEDLPLALVNNLFMKPDVDLKSLFWKVRFLTKLHRLLSSLSATGAHEPVVEACIKQQSCRIETHVKRLIQYLVNVFLHPAAKSKRPYFLLPDDILVAADPRYYYVLPTIWCAVKAIPNLDLDLTELSTLGAAELSRENRLPDDSSTCAFWSQDTVLLLQWYHYASLLKLSESKREDWGALVDSRSLPSLKCKASQLRRTATLRSAAKLASGIPYSTGDEIFDRLASLAPDFGFDGGHAVASLSTSRIRNRSLTKEINPGKPPDDDESANLSGPWEVNALCHHSRLKAIDLGTGNPAQHELWAGNQWKRDEVRLYKGKLYHFLNAEGTLVSTWERVDVDARRGLLRSETTAVVASTFLDLYQALVRTQSSTNAAAGQESQQQHKDVMQELSCISAAAARHRESNKKIPSTEKDGHPFSWSRLAPPRIYHPPDFINSLDDTPERYRPQELKDIPVPAALDDHYTKPTEALTRKTIVDVPDLDLLFLIDVVPFGSVRYIGMDETVQEKRKKAKWKEWERSLGVEPLAKFNRNEDLIWRLYDSLVDQEVCHRFLGVGWSFRPDLSTQSTEDEMRKKEKHILSKEMITMLMYIAHPEAIGCLASHFLKAPRFVPVQRRTMWLARITLRSWKMFDPPSGTSDRPTTDTYDRPIRLPKNLLEPLEALEGYNGKRNREFHLQVSSFVITTTALGDFSKCTIISDLVSEKQLKTLAEDSCDVWEKFVHQPQTARCIVFLLVLQKLCSIITEDYRDAINHFSNMISLEVSFFSQAHSLETFGTHKAQDCFKGEDWEKETGAHGKFQLGLWSLESLSILQVSLKESVNSILEAKNQLLAQIKQGPGTRSQTLENMCEQYLLQFETVLARLMGVNHRLESRMTLSGAYKDALSTVLALRASETSLKQSRTIQKLTYLTITYLPLSLMAALLSIDGNRAVTPSDGGTTWYVGASMILLVITIALAACIGRIVDFFLVRPYKQLKVMEKSSKTSAAEPAEAEEPRWHCNLWLWLLVLDIAISSARALWCNLKKSWIFIWGCVKDNLVSFVKWVASCFSALPRDGCLPL